jgi:hypothetical protein
VTVQDIPFQTISAQETEYDWMSQRDSAHRPLAIRRR